MEPGRQFWPHLDEEDRARRRSIANRLVGSEHQDLDDGARSVMSLADIINWNGDELYLYASSPEWHFGGAGASWLSFRLCDMGGIAPDGRWLQGEAAELGTAPGRFAELMAMSDTTLWAIMAANPACPSALINLMVRSDIVDEHHEYVRLCAAHNPGTDSETLRWLIERSYQPLDDGRSEDDEPNSDIRFAALQNPATPLDVLETWSRFGGGGLDSSDTGWQERGAVARNWGLPVPLMVQLSQDAHRYVRFAMARNPCAIPEVLSILSFDEDEDVRKAAHEAPDRNATA